MRVMFEDNISFEQLKVEEQMKKVYIVHFYCCRLDPNSIYGVYSTQKKAKEASKEVDGWIETFTVDKGKKVYVQ